MTVKEAEDKYRKIIAANIRRYLNEKGWSNAELARQMKVSPTIVGKWLKADKKPTDQHIDDMCRLFGCDRYDITDEPETVARYRQRKRLVAYSARLENREDLQQCVDLLENVSAEDMPRVIEMIKIFAKEEKNEET